MKKIFLLLLCCSFAFAQDKAISNELIEDLQNNMTVYRIHYFFTPMESYKNPKPIVDMYALQKDEYYDLKIKTMTDSVFPDKKVDLFEVDNYYYATKTQDNQINKIAFSHGPSLELALSKKMLIGIKSNKPGELIFISGNVFKTGIAQDFRLDVEKPESFCPFLAYKLFNYQIEKPEFVKKSKKLLLFKAFSAVAGEAIFIKVDATDFDSIQVKGESGWSDKGSYFWKE